MIEMKVTNDLLNFECALFFPMRCNTDREIWRRDRPMKREKERVRVDLSKLSSILNKLVDISDWRTIHYFHMNWFNFNKGLLFSRFIRYICTSACQMHLHICIFFCVYVCIWDSLGTWRTDKWNRNCSLQTRTESSVLSLTMDLQCIQLAQIY